MLVLANIRGGSEFGPRWQQAGLRENRQKVFDDFIATSEDLLRTGLTSREKFGALGRSNGGLLMGVVVNQRPELYGAVVNGVPLFDMQRYTKMHGGVGMTDEYEIGFFIKRSRSIQALFGGYGYHAERVAQFGGY